MTQDTGETVSTPMQESDAALPANQGANGADRVQAEATLPDGHGGVITRTAPSTAGETFAGGTIVENDVGDSEAELIAAIEATIKPFEEGDLVTGTIVKIDKDETLVDIGYKSEGVIPVRELSIRNDVDPGEVVSVGEAVETLVLQKEDKEGRLILSKKRAQYERAWGRIEDIKTQDGTVSGPVIEVVKGGLIIDIGLRGFLPASLVEMRRVRDLQPYVGKELECRIIELDKNRNNVVLSRRKFLEESQAEQRQDFLTSLTKGEVRTGTVSSIVNFGAFVDLGGVDGLVHVSELSWKHVDHPGEVVEVGEQLQVEVLDVDLERERVSLSLKATQEDPWLQFARAHEVGEIIEGRVTKLVPFGAFVEVDEAIEGLVHISELAEHHVERSEDELSVHDRIQIKIIDIDLDRRRISLSRKQAMRDEGGAPEVTPDSAGIPETTEMELEPAGGGPSPELEAILAEGPTPTAEEAILAEESTVPDEEAEEAERVALLSQDTSPEGGEHLTAAEPDTESLTERLLREEGEGSSPTASFDEADAIFGRHTKGEQDAGAAAADTADQVATGEAAAEEQGTGDDAEQASPDTGGKEESIESILEDLRQERRRS